MTLNDNTNKRWIDSANAFVMEQVQLITEYHLVWAELISKLSDFSNRLKGNPELESFKFGNSKQQN